MKKIEYHDLYRFHWPSDVRFAPDGQHAVFVRTDASEEKNGYVSDLWLIKLPEGHVRRLTSGGDAREAFWLDARTVAFSTNRGHEDGEKVSVWYRISIDGGEASPFMKIPGRVSAIQPLGGDRFALVAMVRMDREPEEHPFESLEGRDYYWFEEIPFWSNGTGIVSGFRKALMVYDRAEETLEMISPKTMNVEWMHSSADGKRIAYCGCAFMHRRPAQSGLYLYDTGTGESRTLVDQDASIVGMPCFMGDRQLFFTETIMDRTGRNPRFRRCDLETGAVTALPFHDVEPKNNLATDCVYGAGLKLKWNDGKLYMPVTVASDTHLVRMDAEGQLETIWKGPGAVQCFDVHGDQVLMCAMKGTGLPEVWRIDTTTGSELLVTNLNGEFMATHRISEPERFAFTGRSGTTLEGFIMKPVDYDSGRRYPGIFQIHGGPKVTYGGLFNHEMQCFAAQGYFVFYTNPRGSDGRGEDFADITGRLGYDDYEDLMDFCDEVVARYPNLDEKRIGICGGSYGGFMCNWMIGHTDRFAAAASQRSISNYVSKMLCSDNGFNHNMVQMGTDMWKDFDEVWNHSPLKYAHKAVTPTLFIQSDEDYRCWMGDAVQMFNALKKNGVEGRMVLFHGENHDLSRTGKPGNRIARLREIGNWFERFLKE